MKPFRFPILGLMVAVLACGLSFAALRDPSPQGASLTYTRAMTVLLFGLLALFVGRYRTFWLGFVIFGWGYAYLAFGPQQWRESRSFLYTSRLLSDAYSALLRTKTPADRARLTRGQVTTSGFVDEPTGLRQGDLNDAGAHFQRIGHSIAAILHGMAGGIVAVFLERHRKGVGLAIADHPGGKAVGDGGPP
jgi:hypothetical protein